jgi:signal transduction histidine kinase
VLARFGYQLGGTWLGPRAQNDTARLEKEQQIKREPDFRQLFEAGPAMVLVLDPHFRVVAASDAFLAAKQLQREAIGRGVFDVLPDQPEGDAVGLRESLERVRRTCAPDTMPLFRRDVVRTEGGPLEERYWTAVNSPILDEWKRLSFIVHRVEDVTEFARLDEADGAPLIQMRREILLRSEELAEANRGLRAASDAKNAFLARMSHEMRSPLTAVMGFSELLSHSELDGRQRERITMIRKASDHLLTLLNEVLDLARIEAGDISISLESVAFCPLVADSLALMRPAASTYDVRLRPLEVEEGCAHVLADNQRLRLVLINLISNAI